MTLVQYRRAEHVCQGLGDLSRGEDLVERIRTHLEGARSPDAGIILDGAYDASLDDAIVLGEATLASARSRPAGEERRVHPRYCPHPHVPVLVAHSDLGSAADCLIADISFGGLRLVAPPTARTQLRWADPVKVVVGRSEEASVAGIEGMTVNGSIVRIGADHVGVVLNLRFDRDGDAEWKLVDRWVRRLAIRSFEYE